MNVDCHMHTRFSGHAFTKLLTIRKICEKKQILPCITDHNEIKGALLYRKWYKDCIVGEEIKTRDGEIIGLFLERKIEAGGSAAETCRQIREQGGLVIVPHPFDRMRKGRLSARVLSQIKPDAVEIFNSRTLFSADDRRAAAYAARNSIPGVAGSDAHTRFEIGNAFVEMKEPYTARQFLANLKGGRISGKRTNIAMHIFTKAAKTLGY